MVLRIEEECETRPRSGQSSIDSASLDLNYSRSSLDSSISKSFQEEIASGGIVEPYQYEPVEKQENRLFTEN